MISRRGQFWSNFTLILGPSADGFISGNYSTTFAQLWCKFKPDVSNSSHSWFMKNSPKSAWSQEQSPGCNKGCWQLQLIAQVIRQDDMAHLKWHGEISPLSLSFSCQHTKLEMDKTKSVRLGQLPKIWRMAQASMERVSNSNTFETSKFLGTAELIRTVCDKTKRSLSKVPKGSSWTPLYAHKIHPRGYAGKSLCKQHQQPHDRTLLTYSSLKLAMKQKTTGYKQRSTTQRCCSTFWKCKLYSLVGAGSWLEAID